MATIKSFTSLEQSKVLAEILPLESADMFHFIHEVDTVGFGYKKDAAEFYSKTEFEYIPCWSLAALISIIPQELFNGEYIINITEGLNHKWIISYEHYSEVSSYIDVSSDSLIDCCVEMIIKLKERNLL
jgi:hypothetical protein